MTAAVGYPTLRLVRIAMGITQKHGFTQITLDALKPGQWRYLTTKELKILAKILI